MSSFLTAGLLRDASRPCLACAAPVGACWCGGLPRHPRHDEGAAVPLPPLLPLSARAGA